MEVKFNPKAGLQINKIVLPVYRVESVVLTNKRVVIGEVILFDDEYIIESGEIIYKYDKQEGFVIEEITNEKIAKILGELF